MSYRIAAGSSLRLFACAAALAFTRPLAAQEPRIFINGGDKAAFATTFTTPIPDETIRTLIQTHLPEELRQDDPRSVVLVIDANDQYVSSKAGKAAVVTTESGSGTFTIGDTTGTSGTVVIRRSATGSTVDAPAGTVSVFSSKMSDEAGGVFGSGYSMSDVSTVGLRRFTAGQLGTNAIIVTVVKLK